MVENLKRSNYPACGRLVIMQSFTDDNVLKQGTDEDTIAGLAGFAAINFPSMPDAIELVRQAEYTVTSPWGFPDGIHFYQGTAPLKIPFAFKLHAYDREYCPHGSKSLLQVAAVLQSLVLPVGPDKMALISGYKPGTVTDATQINGAALPIVPYTDPVERVFPPVTCFLELIATEIDNVGIRCLGYVSEVRVKLLGPWLRGPVGSKNLPSAGEFEFTFVHHPGHTNAYSPTSYSNKGEQQAYASVVSKRLYNTLGLLTHKEGFVDSNDIRLTAPEASVAPLAPVPSPPGNTLAPIPEIPDRPLGSRFHPGY